MTYLIYIYYLKTGCMYLQYTQPANIVTISQISKTTYPNCHFGRKSCLILLETYSYSDIKLLTTHLVILGKSTSVLVDDSPVISERNLKYIVEFRTYRTS